MTIIRQAESFARCGFTLCSKASSLRRKRFSAAKCAARPGIEHEETDKIAGDEGELGGAV
jgi:hypothetical protein